MSYDHFLATWRAADHQYVVVWAVGVALAPGILWAWRRAAPQLARWLPLYMLFLASLIYLPAALAAGAVMAAWSRYRQAAALWRWLLPLAIAVRVALATVQPAWYDETYTAAVTAVPLNQLPAAVMADVHPPLPYLISWTTAAVFGRSPFALRLPSLCAGIVLIYLLYLLALLAASNVSTTGEARRVAGVTALFAALMPSLIYYSTDNRYPALLACTVVGALLALLTGRRRTFGAVSALLPWLHAMGFIYMAVFVALAILQDWRHWWRPALVGVLVGGVWLPFMLIQSRAVESEFWLIAISPMWHVVDMTYNLNAPNRSLAIVVLTAVGLTLATLYHWRAYLRTRAGAAWLAVAFGVPVLAWSVSLIWHPVYLPRALLGSAAILLPGWCWLMVSAGSYVRRVAFSLATLALALALSGLIMRGPRTQTPEIFAQCAGADYVYVTSTNMAVIGLYYAPAPIILWPDGDNINQRLSASGKRALGIQTGELEDLRGAICYIVQLSPNTTAAERMYAQFITGAHPYREVTLDDFLTYRIVRFDR